MNRIALAILTAASFFAGAAYLNAQVVPPPFGPEGIAGAYNTSPPTLTNGQVGWVQVDNAGNLKVNVAAGGASGGTSSTFGAAFPATGTAVGMSQGGNMVAFTGTANNLNVNCQVGCSGGTFNNNADAVATSATNGQSAAWNYNWNGATWDRGRSGAVANVAAATGFYDALGVCQYLASAPTLTDTRFNQIQCDVNGYLRVSVQNTNANGQATMANSSPVVIASNQSAVPVINGGSTYETVAASQTGQVLGGSGAIGDYLSHCVIYPQTTTPGVVTVFDDASAAGTNVIAFPGGASSVSNLAPIAIPVGAVSTAGEWRVTTGANVIVTCYGRFS